MPNYARVEGGRVVGIRQATGALSAPDLVEVPEYDADLIGRAWDGQTFGEKAPAPPGPVPLADYLESLTPEEFGALEAATAPEVRQWRAVANLRGRFVHPAPLTVQASQALEAAGVVPASKRPDGVGRG